MAIDMKPGKWYGLGSMKLAGDESGNMYFAIDNGKSFKMTPGGGVEVVKGPNAGLARPGEGGDDKWLHSAWKMNKGGLVRGCGAAKKGKTRGKMV